MPKHTILDKAWTDPNPTKRERRHDKFYTTYQWKKLAKEVLMRDAYLCQICSRNGVIKIVGIKRRDYAIDHKKPRRLYPELELVKENLETVCKKCHAKKSAIEQKIKTKEDCRNENEH